MGNVISKRTEQNNLTSELHKTIVRRARKEMP